MSLASLRAARRRRWFVAASSAVALPLVATSCMNAHERHHFVVSDPESDSRNYFRVDVDAHAYLSSSRYLSGYFDDAAVDAYFGTFKQPADARFPATATAPAKPEGTAGETKLDVQPVDPALAGKRLVMLLSSNSDEIANQISAFADGKEASNLIGRLVSARGSEASQGARQDLEIRRREAQLLAASGDAMLAGALDQDQLLAFANRAATAFGSSKHFADLDEARAWVVEQKLALGGR